MSEIFKRNIEDFSCNHCGKVVKGDGYTNHCPHCLWSRHVDLNPGDRANECGGMMEPIAIDFKNNEKIILHRCDKCGTEKRNKVSDQDNPERILDIINARNKKIFYG